MPTEPRTLVMMMLLLGTGVSVACSGGGGGGGSGSGGGGVPGGGSSVAATLAWSEASGPVDGYRVYVSRDRNTYMPEADVTQPSVKIEGDPGERVRIKVAAFDDKGDLGPLSAASPEILFTETGAVLAPEAAVAASTAAAPTSTTAGGATRSAAAAASEGLPEDAAQRAGDDGASELLWEGNGSASMRLTSLWNGSLRTELAFERPAGFRIAGKDDFDGDGHADLLWENGAGELAISTRAALEASAPATPLAPLHTLGPNEMVIATGDLDGDGLADLLVQDDASGSRSVVLLNAGAAPDVAPLGAGASSHETLAATGDFDGDGRMDLLWRAADGALAVHFMAGAVAYASLALAAGDVAEALATGDFDGDGDDDLVRRDANGAVGVLLMGARQAPAPWGLAVDAGPDWQVAGSGDFDGDAAADLVWVSAAGTQLGFYAGAAVEYVAVEPGTGWKLVSFAP